MSFWYALEASSYDTTSIGASGCCRLRFLRMSVTRYEKFHLKLESDVGDCERDGLEPDCDATRGGFK